MALTLKGASEPLRELTKHKQTPFDPNEQISDPINILALMTPTCVTKLYRTGAALSELRSRCLLGRRL